MEILIILDQIQAGLGGSERGDLSLGGKKTALGSADMFDKYLKSDEHITTTLYCGDDYFMANKEDVSIKLTAMVKKINPDVVICGPAFHYVKYAEMCAKTGALINEKLSIPVVAAMSKECQAVIDEYHSSVDIVKMPKKGGTGLSESLKNILELCRLKVNNEDITDFKDSKTY